MMDKFNLDNRMKTYEYVTRTYLTRRTPVIIRIDGKAFHSFTRGFVKPFDEVMVKTMQETMQYLCEHISGCVLGYTQSDEITLVLCDYKTLTTQAWFDNNIQKICSVTASMATMAFNKFFAENATAWRDREFAKVDVDGTTVLNPEQQAYWFKHSTAYNRAVVNGAMFDSRAFNIPKEEVNNCLLWRQIDATKNSISAVAQANFSQKRLQKKNQAQLIEMLLCEKNIDWHSMATHLKRGSCCIKAVVQTTGRNGETVQRSKWIIDEDIPIFSEDTGYVNRRIIFE